MVRKIKKKGGDDSAPQDDLNLESDAFLDAASESIEWAEDHRSGVIGGIIAVAVAVALGFGYTQYEVSANQDASVALAKALELREAPIVDAGEAQPTSEDDPSFESEEARNAALIEALEETAKSAGGLTDIANLYLAGALWDAGQEDRAFDLTKQQTGSLKPSDPIGFLAHQRLAAWQEDRGDLDGAVATLKGLRAAKGFYVPHAMFDIARVEMARGNKDEAKNLFEALEREHEDFSLNAQVKARLAELRATE